MIISTHSEETTKTLESTCGRSNLRVSCDLRGSKCTVEVSADSLYEALARGLRVFRENNWVDDLGRG